MSKARISTGVKWGERGSIPTNCLLTAQLMQLRSATGAQRFQKAQTTAPYNPPLHADLRNQRSGFGEGPALSPLTLRDVPPSETVEQPTITEPPNIVLGPASTGPEHPAAMKHEFAAVIERDEDWFVAYAPEVPGANGQGRTRDEALESLSDAISLILEDRREDGLRGLPSEAERTTVRVAA